MDLDDLLFGLERVHCIIKVSHKAYIYFDQNLSIIQRFCPFQYKYQELRNARKSKCGSTIILGRYTIFTSCCVFLCQSYTLPVSVRRELQQREEGDVEEHADTAASALPPRYQDDGIQRRPLNIAPPDYRDALQDMVIGEPVALDNQVRP